MRQAVVGRSRFSELQRNRRRIRDDRDLRPGLPDRRPVRNNYSLRTRWTMDTEQCHMQPLVQPCLLVSHSNLIHICSESQHAKGGKKLFLMSLLCQQYHERLAKLRVWWLWQSVEVEKQLTPTIICAVVSTNWTTENRSLWQDSRVIRMQLRNPSLLNAPTIPNVACWQCALHKKCVIIN